MIIEELRSRMKEIADKSRDDPEKYHDLADELLIEFINDDEVTQHYENVYKWYA